jgi:thymidine kinase
MASLYFYYSTMNAGKSTQLLQAAFNYEEFGKPVIVLKTSIDHRDGVGKIASRIGISKEAIMFHNETNLKQLCKDNIKDVQDTSGKPVSAIFVDESQFLTEKQVWELSDIVDELKIPVLCYGLRTDAFGNLFTGSKALLAIADNLNEIKAICQYCGSKATMVFRVDEHGHPVKEGNVIQIGGNEQYHACCRKHWKQFMQVMD